MDAPEGLGRKESVFVRVISCEFVDRLTAKCTIHETTRTDTNEATAKTTALPATIAQFLMRRVAEKVPIVERNLYGLSSSSVLVTKINLPEKEFPETFFALKINVPFSRQQVPLGSSRLLEIFNVSAVVDQIAG